MAPPVRRPELTVRRGASDAVRRGHPWVYREALPRDASGPSAKLAPGAEVQLVDERGAPLGCALFDPNSPIAARVFTQERVPIDDALLSERIARALARRVRLFDASTTAFRVLHGEGDRLPGFVVDRYADAAILRLDGGAAEAHASRIARLLVAPLREVGVTSLTARSSEKGGRELHVFYGAAPPATTRVLEHGVPFVVDLARGQKTGAFLDQRENRRRVGELVKKAGASRVLNLFSYAGGFSLHAALAGATTTSVDIAAQAHATAQASFAAAGVDGRKHEFVAADAFAFLAESQKRGRTWDLVISDPPSFAPNERSLPRALSAYRKLHQACTAVLAPGGIFCAASCSSHVDAQAFASTLDDAALGRSDLSILDVYGPPSDHPTLPAWPEGRYLKFVVLA